LSGWTLHIINAIAAQPFCQECKYGVPGRHPETFDRSGPASAHHPAFVPCSAFVDSSTSLRLPDLYRFFEQLSVNGVSDRTILSSKRLKTNKKEVFQMTGYEFWSGYWWIFPLVMVVFCFFFMRGCAGRMMCGWRSGVGDSALDVLDRRYAAGEINQEEYEERKKQLTK
jgi:putative membrane protein